MPTTIRLDGVVGWDIEPIAFTRALNEADDDIVLEMNSPGGYITDGMAIMNAIRNYDKGTINANITYAASMMTQIASVCDSVSCYSNSIFMIHHAQGGGYGSYMEVQKSANRLESFSNMLANNYVKQSGKEKEEIMQMMTDETYLFGQEIIDTGFATSIIDSDNEQSEDEAKALAHDAFKNCNEMMNEKPEDSDKVAAILKIDDANIIEKVKNIKKDDIIKDKNLKTKGESVDFTKEDVEQASMDARTAETARASGIMDLNCDDAIKIEAIKAGTSVGDVAIKILTSQKNDKTAALTAFENGADKIKNVETPDAKPDETAEKKESDSALEAITDLNLKRK